MRVWDTRLTSEGPALAPCTTKSESKPWTKLLKICDTTARPSEVFCGKRRPTRANEVVAPGINDTVSLVATGAISWLLAKLLNPRELSSIPTWEGY